MSDVTRGTRVLVTGMSGVGKSTLLRGLAGRGWRTVDADEDGLTVEHADRSELRLTELGVLLGQATDERPLALAVTGEGQGRLYPLVDQVVLLTAPWPVLARRLATRTGNPFGKDPGQAERVRQDQVEVEPLLRRGADRVIDTAVTGPEQLLDQVDGLGR